VTALGRDVGRRWHEIASEAGGAPAALRETALVAFFVAVAVVWWWPLAAHLGDGQLEQPIVDSGFNQWILGWGAHVLPRDPLGFFDANMFHPRPGVLAWGDHLFALDLVAVPLVPLIGLVATYNVLLLGSTALSGWGASLLARALGADVPSSVVAGVLWACTFERLLEFSHIQILATAPVPCALLFLERVLRGRGRRHVIGLAVTAWLTLATNVYLAIFTSLSVGVYAAVAWAVRRLPWRRIVRAGAAWLAAVVAAAPLYVPSLVYQRHQDVARTLADQAGTPLRDLVPWPPPGHPAGSIAREWFGTTIANRAHHTPDLGTWLLLTVLVAVAISSGRRVRLGRAVLPPLTAGVVALVLALGPSIRVRAEGDAILPNPLFRILYAVVPGFDALRVQPRWLFFAALFLAVAGALGLAVVTRRVPLVVRWGVVALFVVGAVVENAPAPIPVFPSPRLADHPVYDWLADQPGEYAILEYPISAKLAPLATQAMEARRMFFSTYHWKRRVSGAVSPVISKSYERDALVLERLGRDPRATAMLRRWDVRYVVFVPSDLAPYPELGTPEEVEARLDAMPGLVRRRTFADGVVYEVSRAGAGRT
jgi:hypothetical protein